MPSDELDELEGSFSASSVSAFDSSEEVESSSFSDDELLVE